MVSLLQNMGFFIVTLILLIIYMSIKSRRFSNPFQSYFGLGDLLFYMAITPLFLLRNYIFFFILSMLFAIVLQLSFRKIMKTATVPLAGFSAAFLIIVLLKDIFLQIQKMTLL